MIYNINYWLLFLLGIYNLKHCLKMIFKTLRAIPFWLTELAKRHFFQCPFIGMDVFVFVFAGLWASQASCRHRLRMSCYAIYIECCFLGRAFHSTTPSSPPTRCITMCIYMHLEIIVDGLLAISDVCCRCLCCWCAWYAVDYIVDSPRSDLQSKQTNGETNIYCRSSSIIVN